jgi:acyl-CoA thioester hydrolase
MNSATEYVLTTEPFVVRRRVRWGECDPAGVVYTARFTDYLLSGVMLFHEYHFGGPLINFRKEQGIETPCKGMNLVFNRALWPDEQFDMLVRVGEIRTSSYDVLVEATTLQGESVFSGTFSPVCIKRGERRAVPIPELMRERLAASIKTL